MLPERVCKMSSKEHMTRVSLRCLLMGVFSGEFARIRTNSHQDGGTCFTVLLSVVTRGSLGSLFPLATRTWCLTTAKKSSRLHFWVHHIPPPFIPSTKRSVPWSASFHYTQNQQDDQDSFHPFFFEPGYGLCADGTPSSTHDGSAHGGYRNDL